MTDPFDKARNASAGMPGHSMSADVGVREAVFDPVVFGCRMIAAMGDRSCRAVADETGLSAATINRVSRGGMPDVPTYHRLSHWLASTEKDDPFLTLERGTLAALHKLQHDGTPAAKPKLGGSIIAWAGDEIRTLRAALNAPTESVKAPEGVTQADRDAARLLRAEIQRQVGSRNGLAEIEDADFDVQLFAKHRHAASPTPITADDAVAKERERAAAIAETWCDEGFATDHENRIARSIAAAILSLSSDTEGEGM